MKIWKKKKGFTLIELLVVIAIIGLLSGIVLVSMSGARNKGKDTRIITSLEQIKTMAALIYDDSGSTDYSELCIDGDPTPLPAEGAGPTLGGSGSNYDTDLATLVTEITAQSGAPVCYDSATNYCVSAPLASGGNKCVGTVGTGGMGSVVCAAANTSCQ